MSPFPPPMHLLIRFRERIVLIDNGFFLLLLLIENSHIKVGTVAIGADLAYQCSLTLTCRLVSQDQCGRQVVGSEVGGQSSAATDGSFLQRERERERVSSYQLGATSVNNVRVYECVKRLYRRQMLCVCIRWQYKYVTDKQSKLYRVQSTPQYTYNYTFVDSPGKLLVNIFGLSGKGVGIEPV